MTVVAFCNKLEMSHPDGIIRKYSKVDSLQFRSALRKLEDALCDHFSRVVYVQLDDAMDNGVFSKYFLLDDDSTDDELRFTKVDNEITPTVLINRRKDELFNTLGKNFGEYPIYNSYEISRFGNKQVCREYFSHLMPRSCSSDSKGELDRLLAEIETVIIKPLRENGGRGVERLDASEVRNYLNNHPNEHFIVQEFTETSKGVEGLARGRHDVRLYVVDGKIGLMAVRTPAFGGYLANTSQGGSITFFDKSRVPSELAKLAKSILKTVDTISQQYFISLDFFKGPVGWRLIEINDQPGVPVQYQTNQANPLVQSVASSISVYSSKFH